VGFAPVFLSLDEVLLLHRELIRAHGGAVGVRDKDLLSSARAQPEQTFHYMEDADVFDIAAAYAFHIVKGHPFNDGNKRTGLAAALLFIDLQHVELDDSERVLEGVTLDVAKGSLDKPGFAAVLRRLAADTVTLALADD
jgi:death-on-curing protein